MGINTRESVVRPTVTSVMVGDTLVCTEADGTILMRAWKTHGVVHAVWRTLSRDADYRTRVVTVCKASTSVAWRNASRFRPGRLTCMSCLVHLSRLVTPCLG